MDNGAKIVLKCILIAAMFTFVIMPMQAGVFPAWIDTNLLFITLIAVLVLILLF